VGGQVPALHGEVLPPTPRPVDLATVRDCRRELAALYRRMKGGEVAAADGTRLAYVLVCIAKMIESSELEQRVAALEAASHGKQTGR
jgi:hypothetical protein